MGDWRRKGRKRSGKESLCDQRPDPGGEDNVGKPCVKKSMSYLPILIPKNERRSSSHKR